MGVNGSQPLRVVFFGIHYGSVIMAKMSKKTEEKRITNEKPISLAGVDFKKLMAAFLQVKPKAAKKKPAK